MYDIHRVLLLKMRAIYSRSIHVQRYASGSIWGVVLCKDVATNKVVKLKGTLERFPIEGDILVADTCEEKQDSKYGVYYAASLIQVLYPTSPNVLEKYLRVTGITKVYGFGDKKLDALLSDPENLWAILGTPSNEWGDAYDSIPVDMRQKLHENFMEFKNKTGKTMSMHVSLLMVRLGIKMPKRVLNNLVKHMETFDVTPETAESYIHDNIIDLISVIPPQYVRQLAESLDMDERTQQCIAVVAAL